MSKLNDIKRKIDELDGGAFQNLCDAYLACKGYKNGYSLGMYTGTDKTAKGNPDTYFVTDNGKYVFVMYTTQKTSFVSKAKEDIDKCFDEEKTGIDSNEIVEVIYCHTYGRLSAGEDKELREYCLQKGAKLSLFGLDVLGNDIFLSYPILAKDKLGISVDTGQINDVDNFIMLHDRNRLSAPLNTEFLFREKEFELAKDMIEKSNILLLYGSAGVGKTRFAIELCRNLVESKGYELLCIKSNSLVIFEDLFTAIEPDKQYIVFVDDANELTGLHYVLDYLHESPDSNRRISKVILTVRDYAHRDVLNKVLDCEKPEIIKLTSLKDEDIRTLIEKRYGISNNHYADRIVKIAQGNARIAMLAAKLLVEQGDIESIKDAKTLYSHYYEKQLNSILSGSKTEICTAGIVAFLQTIYLERLDRFQSVFDSISLTEKSFLADLKHMHNLELVDLCRDKAARISDQSFSNFLIKYVFVDKKYIPFDLMLRTCFEINRGRTIEACNILINVFADESVRGYLEEQINVVWNDLKDEPERFVPFFNAFHMINPTESLLILQAQIEKEDSVEFDAKSIELKADDSKTIENEIISNLCSYKYTEQESEAIELLLSLYDKRPDLFLEVYSALTHVLGIDKDSAYYDYCVQKTIISNLAQKMDEQVDENFKFLFVRVAIYYLKFVFSFTESGRKHAFTLYTIPLATSESVTEYRRVLLGKLKTFYESNQYCTEILEMLKDYGSGNQEYINYDIVREEYNEIASIVGLLDTNNLYHCCIVAHLERVYKRAELPYDEALFHSFTKSKKYHIYYTLKGGRKYLDLSYEEEKVKHKADVETLVKEYNISDYEYMFSVCKESEGLPNRDEYSIGKSLSYAFEIAFTNQVVYTEIVELYLKMDTPCNARASTIVSNLFRVLSVQEIRDLLDKYDYAQKSAWQWEYFVEMPVEAIGQSQVDELLSYFAEPDLAIKSSGYRPIDDVKKYKKVYTDILVSGSRILLQHYDESPFVFSLYFSLMFDHEISAKDLFEWYSTDMELLKQIYLKMVFYDYHTDYKGRFLVEFLKIEPSFIFEYLEVMAEDKRTAYRHYDEYIDRVRRVWREDDYLEKVQTIVDHLYSMFDADKWSFEKCVELLLIHKHGEDMVVARQHEWLDSTIENHIQNEDYIICVFEAISDLSEDLRKKALSKFISLNSNFDMFEKLSIESRSYFGTGSVIPNMQKHISYLESIKPYFSSVKFLKHKQLVEQKIQWWKGHIKSEEIRELLEEWG